MKIEKNPQIEVDVNLLLERMSDLLPDGSVVQHAQIESLLSLRRGESRYKTVTNRWRRTIFDERGIYLDGMTAMGEGYRALTPDEMIRFANRRVRTTGRALKKALAIASAPRDDEITDGNLRAYRARLVGAVAEIAKMNTKALREIASALRPPKQLPRSVPEDNSMLL